jgi:hypothetical protein
MSDFHEELDDGEEVVGVALEEALSDPYLGTWVRRPLSGAESVLGQVNNVLVGQRSNVRAYQVSYLDRIVKDLTETELILRQTATPPAAAWLHEGDTVLIRGLTSSKGHTLNGRLGVFMGSVLHTGRCKIRLSAKDSPAHWLSLRAANLVKPRLDDIPARNTLGPGH